MDRTHDLLQMVCRDVRIETSCYPFDDFKSESTSVTQKTIAYQVFDMMLHRKYNYINIGRRLRASSFGNSSSIAAMHEIRDWIHDQLLLDTRGFIAKLHHFKGAGCSNMNKPVH